MTVLALASSKGGCGKTTAALLLASTLAHRGKRVGILESDSAGNLMHWRAIFERFGTPPRNIAVNCLNTSDPLGHIRDGAAVTDVLIVDLAGGASPLYGIIAELADLIIVPLMVSAMDVNGAAMTAAALASACQRQPSAPRVVASISRYDPVSDGRDLKTTLAKLARISLSVLPHRLDKRRMFKAMPSLPCTLHELDDTYRRDSWHKAIANAEAYTDAVLERLAA
jgi:chromosome partitioning protein